MACSEDIELSAGYLHPGYAESLARFGTSRRLPRSGGWILERQIPDSPYRDATGCYPLFFCQDWPQLHADLEDLGTDLVSFVLVADPFGDYDLACLRRRFDFVRPLKEHFSDKARWLSLGGGTTGDGTDSLSNYKRSWSTETRTVYLCGSIFDHKRYAEITKAKGISAGDYFPVYRRGEFG